MIGDQQECLAYRAAKLARVNSVKQDGRGKAFSQFGNSTGSVVGSFTPLPVQWDRGRPRAQFIPHQNRERPFIYRVATGPMHNFWSATIMLKAFANLSARVCFETLDKRALKELRPDATRGTARQPFQGCVFKKTRMRFYRGCQSATPR